MYTLLVVVLLLAFLFDTAAATSPTMDPTLSAPSIGAFYPDPEGMLDFCFCLNMDVCSCLPNAQLHRDPMFSPDSFFDNPQWTQPSSFEDFEPEAPQTEPYDPNADRRPLFEDVVRQLDDNATTMQPGTVQIHVENTYNPGDRLAAVSRKASRRPTHRRQAPRPGGFPCPVAGCGKTFDRSCDSKRHQKTHLGRHERPHKCAVCEEGFLYPKDRNRHQRTHEQSPSSQAMLYCLVPDCANVDGFSRRDNLLRHQRRQHPGVVASA